MEKIERELVERKVAERLYDELTGRKPGVRPGFEQFEPLAGLAFISVKGDSKRDEETSQLLRDAMYLGYSVHPNVDRWGLAVRLARLVVDDIRALDTGSDD